MSCGFEIGKANAIASAFWSVVGCQSFPPLRLTIKPPWCPKNMVSGSVIEKASEWKSAVDRRLIGLAFPPAPGIFENLNHRPMATTITTTPKIISQRDRCFWFSFLRCCSLCLLIGIASLIFSRPANEQRGNSHFMKATQVLVKPLRRWHPHELGCARWA